MMAHLHLHLHVAEAGKQRMLSGDHDAALDRYRAALRMALQHDAPLLFLAHYTDCILDCLEASGDHTQALRIVQQALAEQETNGEPFTEGVRASLKQREIFLLFMLGRTEDGDAALAVVPDLLSPAVAALRQARRRRLTPEVRWLNTLRRQYICSSVTEEHLRREDARHGEVLFLKESAHG